VTREQRRPGSRAETKRRFDDEEGHEYADPRSLDLPEPFYGKIGIPAVVATTWVMTKPVEP
jgi:hypothetical protein